MSSTTTPRAMATTHAFGRILARADSTASKDEQDSVQTEVSSRTQLIGKDVDTGVVPYRDQHDEEMYTPANLLKR